MVYQHGDHHRIPTEYRRHKPGAWLPADFRVHRHFLGNIVSEVDAGKTREKLTPAVEELRQLIEGSPRFYMLFVQMFEEVPQKHPYLLDPEGHKQIRDYPHMLQVLNHIVTRALEWTQAAESVGMVGVPISVVFDYPMGTPSGYAAFLDPQVTRAMKNVLHEWGKYLQTPESASVLGNHAQGWFGETGHHDLLQVANAPYKTTLKFEELFQCDPSAPNMGYRTWDDFFTRRLHEESRPLASPDDDSVVVNACESHPLTVQRNVQLRDRFFAKGQRYSLGDMLAHDPLTEKFVGGTVYQAFLSALSYHRWHAPVSGTIRRAFVQEGTYFSEPLYVSAGGPVNGSTNGVSAEEETDAGTGAGAETPPSIDTTGIIDSQRYLACMATRAIIIMEADNADIGWVAVVPIGMDEVSTCEVTVSEGEHVRKGDELGMFHFGGSTHCLVFPPGVELLELPDMDRKDNLPVKSKLAVVKK